MFLLSNTLIPSSSISFFVTHILLNAFKLDTVAPPIQQENFLLFGEISVTFMSLGVNFWMLLCSLSPKPFIKVVPPAMTIELYKVRLRSMSHFLIASITISWMPGYSRPILSGWKRISGAWNFSYAIFIMLPSGRTY